MQSWWRESVWNCDNIVGQFKSPYVSVFYIPWPKIPESQYTYTLIFFSQLVTGLFSFSFIEMYLRPPSANEEARINDWIKVRQSGIRYYLSLGDQRIVDKHFIIRPKAEFEVKLSLVLVVLSSIEFHNPWATWDLFKCVFELFL